MEDIPTMEELRKFARYPWVRCPSCNKVTGHLQDKYDQILKDKLMSYAEAYDEFFSDFIEKGHEQYQAHKLADQQARKVADFEFNRRIREEVGIVRECCFRTLQNPIVQPLGSGINLDPDVDIGERLSKLQIREKTRPVLSEVVTPRPRIQLVRKGAALSRGTITTGESPHATTPQVEDIEPERPQVRRIFKAD